MPRPLQRVRLESGLKLNLNSLARRGFIKPGAITGPVGIAWTDDTGQEIASGYITADLSDEHGGWLRIRLGAEALRPATEKGQSALQWHTLECLR